MRCGLRAEDATNDDRMGSEDGITSVNCVGCLQQLIVQMRIDDIGRDSPEYRWLAGGDTGISSRTIWHVMMRQDWDDQTWGPDVPHDPSDFGRCVRLLEEFPAWRARMGEVCAAYPKWSGLVEAWDDLEGLYNEELPTGRAPKLWARMQALADG